MRTFAIANRKGGSGKTTTAVNLGAAFVEEGCRVLIVDLDPQAHATLGLGYNPDTMTRTMYDTFTEPGVPISSIILQTNVRGLDLAPSNLLLTDAEISLRDAVGQQFVLSRLPSMLLLPVPMLLCRFRYITMQCRGSSSFYSQRI